MKVAGVVLELANLIGIVLAFINGGLSDPKRWPFVGGIILTLITAWVLFMAFRQDFLRKRDIEDIQQSQLALNGMETYILSDPAHNGIVANEIKGRIRHHENQKPERIRQINAEYRSFETKWFAWGFIFSLLAVVCFLYAYIP